MNKIKYLWIAVEPKRPFSQPVVSFLASRKFENVYEFDVNEALKSVPDLAILNHHSGEKYAFVGLS